MSAYLKQAEFFKERGQHDRAVVAYQAHLALEPENGWVHGLLSLSLAQLKRCVEAKDHARNAIRLLPDSAFSLLAMGYAEFSDGRHGEAALWIEQALAIDPESEENLQLLASIRAAQGKTVAALNAIEQCLRVNPENVACLNLRSSLEIQRGHFRTATQTVQEALRIDAESSVAHLNRGLALLAIGWRRAGLESVKEGLRIDPESDAGRIVLLEALKLKNQAILILIGLRYLFEWIAPAVLILALWSYDRCERFVNDVPPRLLVDDVLLAILYAAASLVVFAKPASDLYVLLFRAGRLATTPEERRLAMWLMTVAAAYTCLFLVLLLVEPARSYAGGMFALLIAASPALPQRPYTSNPLRIRMLVILATAPVLVVAPLVAAAVLPEYLDRHIPLQGTAVVLYQGVLGVVLMVVLYWLSWRENRLQ